MQEYMPLRKILIERVREYDSNVPNVTESPIVQILQYCEEFGVLENVRNKCDGNVPSKTMWRMLIWEKAWAGEFEWWRTQMDNDQKLDIMKMISPVPVYSVWWTISDIDHKFMKWCEIMV